MARTGSALTCACIEPYPVPCQRCPTIENLAVVEMVRNPILTHDETVASVCIECLNDPNELDGFLDSFD